MSERSGTQTWTEWNAEAEHLLESEATLTDAEVAKMERLSRTVFGAVLAMEARRARIREVIERVRADKAEADARHWEARVLQVQMETKAERDRLRVELETYRQKIAQDDAPSLRHLVELETGRADFAECEAMHLRAKLDCGHSKDQTQACMKCAACIYLETVAGLDRTLLVNEQLRAKVERARQLVEGYWNLLVTKCDACDNDVEGVYCECDTLNRCRDKELANLRAALAEEGK